MAFDFGLGFDDDVFGESKVRLKKPTKTYNPKQCEHMWFLKDDAGIEDKIQYFIFQGDALYHQQKWQESVQAYHKSLKITSKRHAAVKRILWESMARCYLRLHQGETALDYARKMVDDSQCEEQKMTSQSLLAAVYKELNNYKEEILCLYRCLICQPLNVHYWLRLAHAYIAMSAGVTQSLIQCTNEAHGGSTDTDQNHVIKSCLQNPGASERTGTEDLRIDSCTGNSDVLDSSLQNGCEGAGSVTVAQSEGTSNSSSLRGQHQCNSAKDSHGHTGHVLTHRHCQADGTLPNHIAPNSTTDYVSISTEDCSSTLCLCSLQSSMSEVTSGIRSPMLINYFAMGCLIRTSILLESVHRTVFSFVKTKNEQLQKEIENHLSGLHIDTAVMLKVRELTENDVFKKGNNAEENSEHERDTTDEIQNIDETLVQQVGEKFEQRYFQWAL